MQTDRLFKEWKIEHRSDGSSFVGVPSENELRSCWIGPMTKKDAEWLLDAVRRKQETDKTGEYPDLFSSDPLIEFVLPCCGCKHRLDPNDDNLICQKCKHLYSKEKS